MLIAARQAGISPIVAVNKADLDRPRAEAIAGAYRPATNGAFLISARTGEASTRSGRRSPAACTRCPGHPARESPR